MDLVTTLPTPIGQIGGGLVFNPSIRRVSMARYLEVAAEANGVAQKLLALVPEVDKPQAADLIARLVNFGIRCSPRGVQHTVRLNAVRKAVQGLPVKVSMNEVTDEKTGRTYNALVTRPIVPVNGEQWEHIQVPPANVEGFSEEG